MNLVNVIDIGNSNIRSYLIDDVGVVNYEKKATDIDTLFTDTLTCFEKCGRDANATIILSNSDCVVWEDKDGYAQLLETAALDHWEPGLPDYKESGHPRYTPLRGAANQMLYLERTIGLENIKRILPISTYVATFIAQNDDYNHWDRTHASNSGFYSYQEAAWAQEAQPFIDAGVINEKIMDCSSIVPGKTTRDVYIGGHDSTFANATDVTHSTKPYISCGTWTTISQQTGLRSAGFPDGNFRYVIAPNNVMLKQLCFPSYDSQIQKTVAEVIKFYQHSQTHNAPVNIFGTWSEDLAKALAAETLTFETMWHEPTQQFGCLYLPKKAAAYVNTVKSYPRYDAYFCDGVQE